MIKLIDVVILFILIGVFVYLYKYFRVEGFIGSPDSSIRFLSTSETNDFLIKDYDMYVANLSPTDLFARKVTSHEDYIRKISRSGIDFKEDQIMRFREACKEADLFFKKANVLGVDCKKIADIPWILSMTKDRQYEDGLPHTRANIIFVSSNINESKKDLIKTMIHEKIHLYQRLYPEEISQYLESNGYTKWKNITGVPRVRANPDLDPFIYYDPVTNKPMVAYYSSDKPYSISDIILDNNAFEHPYEMLAYKIEAMYE